MAKFFKPGILLTQDLPNGGWYVNDGKSEKWYDSQKRLHREDGPAVVSRKTEEYYKHGKMHRIDGPALVYGYTQIWYVDNIRIDTWEQYAAATDKSMKDIMAMVMKKGWHMTPSLGYILKSK